MSNVRATIMRKTKMYKLALLFILFSLPQFSSAEDIKSSIAMPEQYIGYWRLIPVDDKLQSKEYKEHPFKTNCQIFIHSEDHSWLQLQLENMAGEDEAIRQCPKTKEEADKARDLTLSGQKTNFTWLQLDRKEYFGTTTTDHKINFIWQVGYVEANYAPSSESGIPELIKGDLLVMLINPKLKKPYWRGILRRLN